MLHKGTIEYCAKEVRHHGTSVGQHVRHKDTSKKNENGNVVSKNKSKPMENRHMQRINVGARKRAIMQHEIYHNHRLSEYDRKELHQR